MTNNVASSGLRENVLPTNIILTIDGTNGCKKGDIWCKRGTILTSAVGVMQAV